MTTRHRLQTLATFGLLASLIASCGSSDDTAGNASVATNVATTTQQSTTVTTTPPPTTVSTEAAATVETTRDLPYHQGDDRFNNAEGLLDVVAPVGNGPWPVVVAFHGDPRFVGRSWMIPIATSIADSGRVVFVPEWGHPDLKWQADNSLTARFDILVEEVTCAVVFAKANAAEFGGDPEHITLYGYSAGANAALMAGLADAEPLAACAEPGPTVVPQAIVSGDGDLLLGAPDWDTYLKDELESFYAFAPWRYLDEADEFPIYVAATEDTPRPYYDREFGSDPTTSFLADRHTDIDLISELTAMGLLEDGGFSIRDGNQWAYETLLAAGYDTEWVLLPDSTHESLTPDATALLIDTIVHAEAPSG
jgi:acetyl esterase/lipase